jgi:N5-(cytidine 5'-diphosphoramidyl)-L-glutamine hydrolase
MGKNSLMKKIAITQRLVLNEDYYELREALDVNWGRLFNALDFLPIVLPMEYSFEKYFDIVGVDGILLTGGNDLNSLNPSKISKRRDAFEKRLIEYAIVNDVPVFGICRGMQIIGEFFGADFRKVENQVAIEHFIMPNKSSLYFNELNQINMVNSFHNYAINNLPDDILISATNENKMIKAIEHRTYKIFAQMWHSERKNKLSKNELNLIRAFYQ